MKFKKNTGSKLTSLKKEIEECNIDIKVVEETHLYLECKRRSCPLWADSGSLSYDATKYFPNH